jgi:hypothetical protein
MKLYEKSPSLEITDVIQDIPIYVIYQYFVPLSDRRTIEYKYCLNKNVSNPYIHHIYLLNEKIYSTTELGVKSDKITQINLNRRLSYKDIFDFVQSQNLNGYIVFMNADIFVNDTIQLLKQTRIHEEKTMLALLRYDMISNTQVKIFGPRPDSQDTWIFHSNFIPSEKERRVFNFNFGKPGCDNKFTYLCRILGYKIINCPDKIKTIHVHLSKERNYTAKDVIGQPHFVIEPTGFNSVSSKLESFIISDKLTNHYSKYTFNDNNVLREYIQNTHHFIIPRIAGVENHFAYIGKLMSQQKINDSMIKFIKERTHIMKNNAGIYFKTFEDIDIYTVWEPYGIVYNYISQSHNFITENYSKNHLWAITFEIFHYIHLQPWTTGLRGKRILIISSFVKSIKEKIPIREKIYGVELFPECEFVFLKPPQTNGANPSRVFKEELNDFIRQIEEIKDTFDVALVSCGGYGNLVCNAIYEMGRSSIYVGGVLQMYFGIYGARWLRERKDIMNLYMNEYWSRPKEDEKPANYKSIEGNCYW